MFYWPLLAVIISVFSTSVANTVYGRGSVGIFQISTFADTASRTVVQIIVVFFRISLCRTRRWVSYWSNSRRFVELPVYGSEASPVQDEPREEPLGILSLDLPLFEWLCDKKDMPKPSLSAGS
jgi:hypothetical protein